MTAAGTTKTLKHRSALAAISGRRMLARVVGAIAAIVALILLAGIALVLLKANPSNEIVNAIRDAAAWLAGPFDGMFQFDRTRTELAVNWGIAGRGLVPARPPAGAADRALDLALHRPPAYARPAGWRGSTARA